MLLPATVFPSSQNRRGTHQLRFIRGAPGPESLGSRGRSPKTYLERRSWNPSSPFWRNWLLTCAPFSLLRLTRPLITETPRSRLHSSTCSQCKHRRTLHFMAVF